MENNPKICYHFLPRLPQALWSFIRRHQEIVFQPIPDEQCGLFTASLWSVSDYFTKLPKFQIEVPGIFCIAAVFLAPSSVLGIDQCGAHLTAAVLGQSFL